MLNYHGNTTKGVRKFGKIYKGKAGVVRSITNTENDMEIFNEGDQIILKREERHRLIGLEDYAIVAEI